MVRHRQKIRRLSLTLVLYSHDANLWKIADFGITSKATEKRAITTRYNRGTEGYRAPELTFEPSHFTNKVDIWALGCIFFELLAGKQAFKDDWKVREYYNSSSRLELSIPGLPKVLEAHQSEIIHELLHRNHEERPRIKKLRPLFECYLAILDPSATLWRLDDLSSLPSYYEWKTLVHKHPNNLASLFFGLVEHYEQCGNIDNAISLLVQLVKQSPADKKLRMKLENVYRIKGDFSAAIETWYRLVNENPYKKALHEHLTKACIEQGGIEVAVGMWESLTNKYPTNARLGMVYREVYSQALQTIKQYEEAVQVLKGLVAERPGSSRLRKILATACETIGDEDKVIAVWKELVNQHPEEETLLAELKKACDEKGDEDETIAVWRELVENHPSTSPQLLRQLRDAFEEKGDEKEAIAVWRALAAKHNFSDAIRCELLRVVPDEDDDVIEVSD
jgi:Flp pilus assembly protein TadD